MPISFQTDEGDFSSTTWAQLESKNLWNLFIYSKACLLNNLKFVFFQMWKSLKTFLSSSSMLNCTVREGSWERPALELKNDSLLHFTFQSRNFKLGSFWHMLNIHFPKHLMTPSRCLLVASSITRPCSLYLNSSFTLALPRFLFNASIFVYCNYPHMCSLELCFIIEGIGWVLWQITLTHTI
jgi:hypothetical protein